MPLPRSNRTPSAISSPTSSRGDQCTTRRWLVENVVGMAIRRSFIGPKDSGGWSGAPELEQRLDQRLSFRRRRLPDANRTSLTFGWDRFRFGSTEAGEIPRGDDSVLRPRSAV